MHTPTTAKILTDIKKTVLSTGSSFEGEVELEISGKLVNYTMHIEPLKAADSTIMGITGTVMDITERLKSQQKIKESEELFNTFSNNIQNLAWIAEGDGSIFWYNQRWLDYTGLALEDMRGGGWQKVHHPEHVQSVVGQLKKLWVTNEPFELTFPLRRFDGEYRWFLTRGVPITDENGKIFRWIGTNTDIDDQIKSQVEVRYRKALLEAHNQASVDGLLLVDAKGKIISYNKRFIEIWNMPQHIVDAKDDEAALNFAMGQLLHPEQFIEKVKYLYDHPNETSKDVLEYKDGQIIERNGYPVIAEDGSYYAWSWTFRDITEQQTAQRRIKESEQRFKTVADSAPVLIWMSGTDSLFYFFNFTWLNFTGRKLEEELGHGWVDGVHADDRERCLDAYSNAFNKREAFYLEYRLRRHDGIYRWLSDSGTPRFTSEGTFEGFIGACSDIHERVMFEIILRESEEKFRLLADSMPQFVWTSNEKGDLNYFNKAVFSFTGLSKEDIDRDGWLQLVHLDDKEENEKQWLHSIETGDAFNFEHRFRRHDGEFIWQLSRAIPQRDATGKIQMWVGISTEIQHQKEMHEELERQVQARTQELVLKNSELEKMNKELESFTYISSHDLQEPLRKIQTFATRIVQNDEQNLSETGKDYFQRMQTAAARMQRLIEDLLAFSRTATGERTFELTKLSVVVEEVKKELKEVIKEKSAVIELSNSCEINIIPFQFYQLMQNLISNAIKFAKGDQQPHIKIKSRLINPVDTENSSSLPVGMLLAGKEYWHIIVKDNGIGFDQKYSGRIFEVFQRLHGKNEYIGTGIGLAIVKKIIDNHNGFITATGEVGIGATFNIFIPKDSA